uniref:SFRICE_036916 n=1 Tax=Spodoptera frugiperda TaxID=7108 RepID=A0A2H1WU84_SPOFR
MREQMKCDFETAQNTLNIECLSFDLEKILPLPRIPTNLWLYNSGIHSASDDVGHFDDKHHRINDKPDLGPTGNTVVRLTRIVPRRANHIIYFDNYYTSVPLVTYLAKEGIYCFGTIQSNRIPNNKLPDKKTLMKRTVPRGHHEEQVANVDSIDISAVVWKDNKPLTLLSTYTGAMPVTTISRYDKATKQRVPINCPNLKKKRGPAQTMPPKDVRQDKTDHWQKWGDRASPVNNSELS